MTQHFWTRLRAYNNWGKVYYAPVGEGLNSHGTADPKRGCKLKDGDFILFRPPSGTPTPGTLRAKVESFPVADHGKESRVSCTMFFIEHEDIPEMMVRVDKYDVALTHEQLNEKGRT